MHLLAQHLDIGYEATTIVRDINIEVGAGQSLAIVGINGSGKSTLLRTLVGLQPPRGGKLEVLDARPGSTPHRVAYLSQFHPSGFILPLRAVDVVGMGRFPSHGLLAPLTEQDHLMVSTAMRTMEIAHLADAPLRSLSGGQQQRVYLAQALARQADLLVLDEPTAGLDAGGREVYLQVMRSELARGATLITATHDLQEASERDVVMLLARRVVAIGPGREVLTPEALLETFGVILMLKDQKLGLAVVDREPGHDQSEPPRFS
jgi:ABC-type Mn2+/Zn2+ transport system ATPase subunit